MVLLHVKVSIRYSNGYLMDIKNQTQFLFQDGHLPHVEPTEPAKDIPLRVQHSLRRRPHV